MAVDGEGGVCGATICIGKGDVGYPCAARGNVTNERRDGDVAVVRRFCADGCGVVEVVGGVDGLPGLVAVAFVGGG